MANSERLTIAQWREIVNSEITTAKTDERVLALFYIWGRLDILDRLAIPGEVVGLCEMSRRVLFGS